MFSRHRLYLPILFVLLSIGGYAYVQTRSELDNNIAAWLRVAIPTLCALLTLLWFVLLSGFRWKTRLTILAALILLGVGLRLCLRLDGSLSGTGLPRYRWVWTPETVRSVASTVQADVFQPTHVAATDSPTFLGSARDGILPLSPISPDWKTSPPKELWRQDMGEGWSAFAVSEFRAVTLEQRGAEEWVSCYDLGSGQLFWHHAEPVRFTEWQGGDGPRSTPTIAGDRVYAIGATGILNCLDLATGKSLWKRNPLEEHQSTNHTWAVAASPLLVDDLVIVIGGKEGPTLVAYAQGNGEPRWKSGTASPSYATPVLTTLAGQRVIACNNALNLSLHDPATGALLMEYKWGSDKMPKASQPVILPGDRVFLSAGYAMGCVMLQITRDTAGTFSAQPLWEHHKMKTQFNTVTLLGDYLYGLDDGRLACLEVSTGERLWKEGRFGNGQHLLLSRTQSTPLALIQSEPGPVYLVETAKEGIKELAKVDALSAKTWNYPTLAGRYLLVRNDREAVCYELPVAP
jgi:outer membrane protein assembly factor BamB